MNSSFKTEDEAVAYLKKQGFRFDIARLVWHRKHHSMQIKEVFARGQREYMVRQVNRCIV